MDRFNWIAALNYCSRIQEKSFLCHYRSTSPKSENLQIRSCLLQGKEVQLAAESTSGSTEMEWRAPMLTNYGHIRKISKKIHTFAIVSKTEQHRINPLPIPGANLTPARINISIFAIRLLATSLLGKEVQLAAERRSSCTKMKRRTPELTNWDHIRKISKKIAHSRNHLEITQHDMTWHVNLTNSVRAFTTKS